MQVKRYDSFLIRKRYYQPRLIGGAFRQIEREEYKIFYPNSVEGLQKRLVEIEKQTKEDPHQGPIETDVNKVSIGKTGWSFKNEQQFVKKPLEV